MSPLPELSEEEKKVFDLISKGDLSGLATHMTLHGIKPNILDDHGMTPLTHACFKGNKEISQFLIDQVSAVETYFKLGWEFDNYCLKEFYSFGYSQM